MKKLFESNEDQFPKSRHITNVGFVPTNYHHNEYNLQKNHAENILKASWKLTFTEWCELFLSREQLRDYPPVTTTRWVTRIDITLPFQVGNLRCGTKPEGGTFRTTTYKAKSGKWVPYYDQRCR